MTVPVEKQALAERLKAAGLTSRDGTFVHASTREVVETVAALRSPVEVAGEPVALDNAGLAGARQMAAEHVASVDGVRIASSEPNLVLISESTVSSLTSKLKEVERERDEARSIVRDIHWMAVRYADGRKSYAPGMCNDALRKAYDGGWLVYDRLPQSHDLDPQYAREGDRPEYRSVEARAEAAEAQAQAAARELEEARAAKVKSLEWVYNNFQSMWKAETVFGIYSAWDINGGVWRSPFAQSGTTIKGDIDEAKAAAQADYESRILSALSIPEPGKTTEDAGPTEGGH